MRRRLLTAAILSLAAGAARADFNAEVTALPDFAAGLTRVAVIAVECHESVDCGQVEDAAAEELVNRQPGFAVVSPADLRAELFARSATELTDELRPEILDKLGADGVLEIRVPFANRGDGFGGRRRSEVRAEVRLVTREGQLRMTGRGSGRPKKRRLRYRTCRGDGDREDPRQGVSRAKRVDRGRCGLPRLAKRLGRWTQRVGRGQDARFSR